MSKVTNELLMLELKEFRREFNIFKEEDYKVLKSEHRLNTEFRQKATGIIAVVGVVTSFIGAIVWKIIDKLWK